MWETLHPCNTLTCNIVLAANTKLANDNYYRLKVNHEIERLHFDWCISLTSVIECMMKSKDYIWLMHIVNLCDRKYDEIERLHVQFRLHPCIVCFLWLLSCWLWCIWPLSYGTLRCYTGLQHNWVSWTITHNLLINPNIFNPSMLFIVFSCFHLFIFIINYWSNWIHNYLAGKGERIEKAKGFRESC